MKPFAYAAPTTLAEALALLDPSASQGDARPLAGGSDLLGELKDGLASPGTLVSLAGIAALGEVRKDKGGLVLGAGVTMARLEVEPLLTGPYALVAEAARGVATPEIRNQGTLGGNLCQAPRCLHYRSHWIPCLKKGGDDCPAALSEHQPYLALFGNAPGGCHAAHASDMAPPLLALDAVVCIEGRQGGREVPLRDFFASGGNGSAALRDNQLAPGELVTAVRLPQAHADWRGTYVKARERTAGDFPLVSAAVGARLEGGKLRGVRIVLGGVAPSPWPRPEAEAVLEGKDPSADAFARAAEAAFADARPLAHNGYKVQLGRALVARALAQVAAALQRR